MKSPIDEISQGEKKSIEKKRYDNNPKNYNSKILQGPPGQLVSQAPTDEASQFREQETPQILDSNVKLNLENLVKIDDKFSQLIDCVKAQKSNSISQLCSDWWELTDEEEYCLA